MTDAEDRKRVGRARVLAALDHIQQAQIELMLAVSDLCSVIGYVPESDRISALHARIKALWYRLDGVRQKGPTRASPHLGDLDHTPTAKEIANPHAGGCGRGTWRSTFFGDPP